MHWTCNAYPNSIKKKRLHVIKSYPKITYYKKNRHCNMEIREDILVLKYYKFKIIKSTILNENVQKIISIHI